MSWLLRQGGDNDINGKGDGAVKNWFSVRSGLQRSKNFKLFYYSNDTI